jgi:hypothetical protein
MAVLGTAAASHTATTIALAGALRCLLRDTSQQQRELRQHPAGLLDERTAVSTVHHASHFASLLILTSSSLFALYVLVCAV